MTDEEQGFTYVIVRQDGMPPEVVTEWNMPCRYDSGWILLASLRRFGPHGTVEAVSEFRLVKSPAVVELEDRLNNPRPAAGPANRAGRRAQLRRKERA